MWSLYEKERFLEPLQFSNGKSKEDVVQEVLQEIKERKKVTKTVLVKTFYRDVNSMEMEEVIKTLKYMKVIRDEYSDEKKEWTFYYLGKD